MSEEYDMQWNVRININPFDWTLTLCYQTVPPYSQLTQQLYGKDRNLKSAKRLGELLATQLGFETIEWVDGWRPPRSRRRFINMDNRLND